MFRFILLFIVSMTFSPSGYAQRTDLAVPDGEVITWTNWTDCRVAKIIGDDLAVFEANEVDSTIKETFIYSGPTSILREGDWFDQKYRRPGKAINGQLRYDRILIRDSNKQYDGRLLIQVRLANDEDIMRCFPGVQKIEDKKGNVSWRLPLQLKSSRILFYDPLNKLFANVSLSRLSKASKKNLKDWSEKKVDWTDEEWKLIEQWESSSKR